MTDKEIFIEKLTEPLSAKYLIKQNHTNFSDVIRCDTWLEVEVMMERNGWNFLGIATPPYNPYGEHFNYAFVVEDKENDYNVLWHHASDRWLNKIAESLGIDYRFNRKNKKGDIAD